VDDIVGCMHFLVEVEKAQLEVELNTPEWYDYGGPWVLCSSGEQGNYS